MTDVAGAPVHFQRAGPPSRAVSSSFSPHPTRPRIQGADFSKQEPRFAQGNKSYKFIPLKPDEGDEGVSRDKTIATHPGVARVHGSEITFRDGTRAEADVIVMCTGYRQQFPFLAPRHSDIVLYDRTSFSVEFSDALPAGGVEAPLIFLRFSPQTQRRHPPSGAFFSRRRHRARLFQSASFSAGATRKNCRLTSNLRQRCGTRG